MHQGHKIHIYIRANPKGRVIIQSELEFLWLLKRRILAYSFLSLEVGGHIQISYNTSRKCTYLASLIGHLKDRIAKILTKMFCVTKRFYGIFLAYNV